MQVQQLPYIAPAVKTNWASKTPVSEPVPVTDYELYGSLDPLELMCLMEEQGHNFFDKKQ